MAEGIRFVMGKPIFNKTNLHALYSILSDGCLLEEKRLKEGDFYRYDGVSVDGYLGCLLLRHPVCEDETADFLSCAWRVIHPLSSCVLIILTRHRDWPRVVNLLDRRYSVCRFECLLLGYQCIINTKKVQLILVKTCQKVQLINKKTCQKVQLIVD